MEVAVWEQNQHHVKSQTQKSDHSHAETARKFRLDRYLDSVLIQGFEYLEDGQHFGHHRPYGRVSKVSPDTDPPTKSERDMFHVVVFKGTVVTEESLWYERLWVGVSRFVMCHRPAKANYQGIRYKRSQVH